MTVSPPGLWNDSLSGFYLWSNTNFGEAVTETMTPLTWSVLRFTLEDWIFIPGFTINWNASSRIRSTKSIVSNSSLGCMESHFDSNEAIILSISMLIFSSNDSG